MVCYAAAFNAAGLGDQLNVHYWLQSNGAHVPRSVLEQRTKLNTIQAELTHQLNRQPSLEEIAAAAGMSPDKVQGVLKLASRQVLL